MKLNALNNYLQGRLRAIRKDQKLSQEEFGTRIGITRSAICNYESGTRPISEQVILAVCREFGVSETWLRDGLGEMYRIKEEGAIAKLIAEYHCSNFEGDFLKSYFQMDQKEREQFVQAMYRLIVPFSKSLEGKNPFADYYDLTADSELIYCKAQRERIDSRIRGLEQQISDSKPIQEGSNSSASEEKEVDVVELDVFAELKSLKAENQELRTRLEAIEKEGEIAEESLAKVRKKSGF